MGKYWKHLCDVHARRQSHFSNLPRHCRHSPANGRRRDQLCILQHQQPRSGGSYVICKHYWCRESGIQARLPSLFTVIFIASGNAKPTTRNSRRRPCDYHSSNGEYSEERRCPCWCHSRLNSGHCARCGSALGSSAAVPQKAQARVGGCAYAGYSPERLYRRTSLADSESYISSQYLYHLVTSLAIRYGLCNCYIPGSLQ